MKINIQKVERIKSIVDVNFPLCFIRNLSKNKGDMFEIFRYEKDLSCTQITYWKDSDTEEYVISHTKKGYYKKKDFLLNENDLNNRITDEEFYEWWNKALRFLCNHKITMMYQGEK